MDKRSKDELSSPKNAGDSELAEQAAVVSDIEIPDGGLKAWTSLAGQ